MKIFRSNSGRLITISTLLLVLDNVGASPQENKGGIEVQVTRRDSTEGIPGAKLTLSGPFTVVTPAMLSKLYSPNPALTPEMKKQVDAMIAMAPPEASVELIASEAKRLEAQLLGLPLTTVEPQLVFPPRRIELTNGSGRYSFENLTPGAYRIYAQRDGYSSPSPPAGWGTESPFDATAIVNVEAGKSAPQIRLALMLNATVSGTVRDSKGQPASGVRVTAYRLEYQNLRLALQEINSKFADERGEYRLFSLPPGEYYLGVTPGFTDSKKSFHPAYTQTFFPGVIDARNATRVKVFEGADLAGFDIPIFFASTNIVSVNSINRTGIDELADWLYYLLPNDTGTISNTVATPSPSVNPIVAFAYEFRGVAPGTYDLISSKFDIKRTGMTAIGRTKITIGLEDLQAFTVYVQPDVEVKARLIVDGGPPTFTMAPSPVSIVGRRVSIGEDGRAIPRNFVQVEGRESPASVLMYGIARGLDRSNSAGLIPYPTIRIQLRSMEFGDDLENFGTLYPAVDASGLFTFTTVPAGRYRIQTTTLPGNAYVADMRIGTKPVYDDGFIAGTDTGQIDVIVNSNGAQVQGTVRDSTQKPFTFAKIALVPAPSRRQNLALYKTVASDANGNFTIHGIAPGDYKLFAWDSVRTNVILNPDFIADHETEGEAITVGEGGRITAALKLIPISLGP